MICSTVLISSLHRLDEEEERRVPTNPRSDVPDAVALTKALGLEARNWQFCRRSVRLGRINIVSGAGFNLKATCQQHHNCYAWISVDHHKGAYERAQYRLIEFIGLADQMSRRAHFDLSVEMARENGRIPKRTFVE